MIDLTMTDVNHTKVTGENPCYSTYHNVFKTYFQNENWHGQRVPIGGHSTSCLNTLIQHAHCSSLQINNNKGKHVETLWVSWC